MRYRETVHLKNDEQPDEMKIAAVVDILVAISLRNDGYQEGAAFHVFVTKPLHVHGDYKTCHVEVGRVNANHSSTR
jgi:hypothetical protein